MTTLTEAARSLNEAKAALVEHEKAAAARTAELKQVITDSDAVLRLSADGIDLGKVALAETVVYVSGEYEKAGTDRASCIAAAIKQLATGKADSPYSDLWCQYLGTKSYDRWNGQRCDCEYGMGPRHGSIIFAIGLTRETLKRDRTDLSPDEIEAAIYYLTNITRIQSARKSARVAA